MEHVIRWLGVTRSGPWRVSPHVEHVTLLLLPLPLPFGGSASCLENSEQHEPAVGSHQNGEPSIVQLGSAQKSWAYSKNKKYFQAPFWVLQHVTNRGLASVPERTDQYLEALWQNIGVQVPITWCLQILIGPSRYWLEFPIYDKLKHWKRCFKVLFFLECTGYIAFKWVGWHACIMAHSIML